jgi:hypothetical protein
MVAVAAELAVAAVGLMVVAQVLLEVAVVMQQVQLTAVLVQLAEAVGELLVVVTQAVTEVLAEQEVKLLRLMVILLHATAVEQLGVQFLKGKICKSNTEFLIQRMGHTHTKILMKKLVLN